MTNLIQQFEQKQLQKINAERGMKTDFDQSFKVGDSVKVKYIISEAGTTRLQAFIGVVISRAKSSKSYSATFTVRKMSDGIGVERKFALHSPLISAIEVMKRGVVRKSKLYYLRQLTGKAARIKEKLDFTNSSKSKALSK